VRECLVFEVTDREFHDRVLAMLSFDELERVGAVCQEREVSVASRPPEGVKQLRSFATEIDDIVLAAANQRTHPARAGRSRAIPHRWLRLRAIRRRQERTPRAATAQPRSTQARSRRATSNRPGPEPWFRRIGAVAGRAWFAEPVRFGAHGIRTPHTRCSRLAGYA